MRKTESPREQSTLVAEFSLLWYFAGLCVCVATVVVIVFAAIGIDWMLDYVGHPCALSKAFALMIPIFEAAVWPVFILFVIFLFRKQLPNLARTISAIKNGASESEFVPSNKNENSFEVPDEKVLSQEQKVQRRILGKKFEDSVLNQLQEQEGVVISRGVSIFGSYFAFDAAFKKNGYIYGVEVKLNSSPEAFQAVLRRVENAVETFQKSDANRFILLICIPDVESARRSLCNLRNQTKMPLEFRWFKEVV